MENYKYVKRLLTIIFNQFGNDELGKIFQKNLNFTDIDNII